MALDAFLQLDGIKGEATESGHQDWIQVVALAHGIDQQTSKNPPGGQRKTTANSLHKPIKLTKRIDKTSPLLHESVCSGKTIKNATIDFLKDAGDKRVAYLKYELTNVLIAAIEFGATHDTDEEPSETISLKYDTIKWTYSATNEQGTVTSNTPAGWDLPKNKKLG